MSSDVEMLHAPPSKQRPHSVTPPPPSASSRTSSASLVDDDLPVSHASTTTPLPVVVGDDDEPKISAPPKSAGTSTAKPASTSASAAASAPAPAPVKPKSHKAARPRSPSPSPPPPPPPLQTIRLEIRLGGPDNYEVDIASIAKATGQRPPTPVPVKRDTSDSEGDDDDGAGTSKDKPKSKKKRKSAAAEYYDVHDPFIDDSELAVDERTWFAQTKQQGFYVSSGEVALLKDKTPRKPKSRKEPASTAGPSIARGDGTRETPIALLSDDDARTGTKRKRYLTVVENGKKRKIVDVHSFHPALQASIDLLKAAIAKESWAVKGKFPPALKPILASVAVQAIELDEYDEHFFSLMPALFPYNKFTMTKLIKRTVFPDHMRILGERTDALLAELAKLAADGFARAEEEWEKSVIAWDKRQEKAKAEAETSTLAPTPAPDAPAPPLSRHPTEDGGSGAEGDAPAGGKDKDREPHPPTKKYRMSDAMKAIVWRLVLLSNECCRLENEKHTLENSTFQVSEQGLRKTLYQKIVAVFPDGWMSSGQISREVSAMKKRMEKEAMENEP